MRIDGVPIIDKPALFHWIQAGSFAIFGENELGARAVRYVCLLAAPEGVKEMNAAHPDVPVITAAVDSHLNDHGYIVPGLGDAGDRLFGTK